MNDLVYENQGEDLLLGSEEDKENLFNPLKTCDFDDDEQSFYKFDNECDVPNEEDTMIDNPPTSCTIRACNFYLKVDYLPRNSTNYDNHNRKAQGFRYEVFYYDKVGIFLGNKCELVKQLKPLFNGDGNFNCVISILPIDSPPVSKKVKHKRRCFNSR